MVGKDRFIPSLVAQVPTPPVQFLPSVQVISASILKIMESQQFLHPGENLSVIQVYLETKVGKMCGSFLILFLFADTRTQTETTTQAWRSWILTFLGRDIRCHKEDTLWRYKTGVHHNRGESDMFMSKQFPKVILVSSISLCSYQALPLG